MHKNLVFLFMAVGVFTFIVLQVHAEHFDYSCAHVENTADIMSCVNKRHDEATKRLNTIFETLIAEISGESAEEQKATLRQAQKDWLLYRDRACAWEIDQEQTESLKRIRSLSCQSILAEQRADILSMSLTKPLIEDESGLQGFAEHYSTTPRWMNVLAADYPDVFWRYHDYIQVDLDCDGEKELIMPGVRMNDRTVRTEEAERYLVKAVVSVTDNPATGRPKPQLFDFVVSEKAEDNTLQNGICSVDLNLSVVDEKTEEQQDGVSPEPSCKRRLQIKSTGCTPRYLFWNGETYAYASGLTE